MSGLRCNSDQAAYRGDDTRPMDRSPPTITPARRLLVVGLVVFGSWSVPAGAAAACSPQVRADSKATAELVAQLTTSGAAGATDVAEVYARARRTCIDIRPVRSIAAATARLGLPTAGRRANVRGVPLVGVATPTSTAWRVDLKQLAVRIARARTWARARADVVLLRSVSVGVTARTFGFDPTRTAWDPASQAVVATILGTSVHPQARAYGDAGVRAFGAGSRISALSRLPLLAHLMIANRVAAVSARSTTAAVEATSARLAVRAMVRIRAARAQGWSRIDGAWSSGPAHRALVARSTLLLRRHPHPLTQSVVTSLQSALRVPAKVDFGTLPVAAFYPWPRDGAFDWQSVSIDVNKPGVVSLLVYASGDQPIRTLSSTVEPGLVTLTWDGADAAGTILGAGAYRYNIDVVDPVGNRARVAGLDRFTVARDTTPPTVQTASVRAIGTGTSRRVVASWAVTEVHSPKVTTWLLLTSGARTERIRLQESLQKATVRRPITLPAGSWRATLVFADGSGNRVSRPAGTFGIRAGTS